jgi:transcriptional regulator with XRE-family HTH domain
LTKKQDNAYNSPNKGGAIMAELLGDRIRHAREVYGMSQAELSRRIKISKQAMYDIESNRTRNPGVLIVNAIADVLRVSVDALLGRGEQMASAAPTPPKRPRPRKVAPVG